MADLTYYINLGSSAGGDGTTNNTTGATRAWASIAEAQSSLESLYPSFVSSDVNITVEITGNALDSAWIFQNITMDATHTLTYRVAEASFHNWIKDSGYRCGQITVNSDATYLFLDGLSITGGANAGVLGGLNNPNGDNLLIYNNYYGLSGSGNYDTCLVIDNNSRGVYANSSGGVITANKCTAEGNANVGFRGAPGTVNATDCYSGNNVNGGYLDTVNLNTCASDDTTGSAGLQNVSITSAFVDPNNGDYTPITSGPLDGTASDGGDIGAIQIPTSGSSLISGTITTSSNLSATIEGKALITGAITSGSTLSATIEGLVSVSGDITTTTTLSATISGKAVLSGGVSSGSTLSGAIGNATPAGNLLGAISTGSTVSGSVSGVGSLTGSVISSSVLSGGLKATIEISGTITTTSSVYGAIRNANSLPQGKINITITASTPSITVVGAMPEIGVTYE